jgi:hypothetical protein
VLAIPGSLGPPPGGGFGVPGEIEDLGGPPTSPMGAFQTLMADLLRRAMAHAYRSPTPGPNMRAVINAALPLHPGRQPRIDPSLIHLPVPRQVVGFGHNAMPDLSRAHRLNLLYRIAGRPPLPPEGNPNRQLFVQSKLGGL